MYIIIETVLLKEICRHPFDIVSAIKVADTLHRLELQGYCLSKREYDLKNTLNKKMKEKNGN